MLCIARHTLCTNNAAHTHKTISTNTNAATDNEQEKENEEEDEKSLERNAKQPKVAGNFFIFKHFNLFCGDSANLSLSLVTFGMCKILKKVFRFFFCLRVLATSTTRAHTVKWDFIHHMQTHVRLIQTQTHTFRKRMKKVKKIITFECVSFLYTCFLRFGKRKAHSRCGFQSNCLI